MDQPVSIRGKVIGSSELEFIKAIVDIGWSEGRTWISRELCRQWDWRQQNGHLKDQVCRIMLNELSRLGHVELPPPKRENGVTTRRHYVPSLEMPSYSQEPLQGELGDFGPITLKMVRRAPEEKLWNHLVHQYHYMGYRVLVGSHLKYMVFMDQKPVACLAWASRGALGVCPKHRLFQVSLDEAGKGVVQGSIYDGASKGQHAVAVFFEPPSSASFQA
jgi:hypothetical protein